MLQTIRSHAGSWVIKCILGAIVASFAFVGISDMIRGHGHGRPVATVGNGAISLEEFSYAYKQAVARLQHMMKAAVSAEQLKEMGVPEKVLENLIERTLMEQEIKTMGIVVPDQTVKEEVYAIPAFLNEKGQFNRAAFTQLLQSQGISEARFIQDVRKDLQQHQFVTAMTSGLIPTKEEISILFQALEQPHQFVALTIPFKSMAVDKHIEPHTLNAFFQGNKEQFRKPEFRSFTLLRFDRKTMKQEIVVDDAEVQETFERTKDQYHTPEKRHVESVTLPNNELARKAMEMFRSGKPLKAIARELKGGYRDLGVVSKADLPEAHGAEIFQTNAGSLTKPFDVATGWMLFAVTKIVPAQDKTFDMVRDAIRTSLQNEKFNTHFETIQNQIEDALAGGESMQAIADKYHLVIESVSSIDKFGLNQDGQKILEDAIAKDALAYIFSNDKGATSSVIMAKPLEDSTLMAFIVRVDGVRESSIPSFKDIEDKVKDAFYHYVRNQKAMDLAKTLSKNITSISDLKKQGELQKLAITTFPPISRSTMNQETLTKYQLSQTMVEDMFALPEGEVFIAPSKDGVKLIMLQGKLPFTRDAEKQKKFAEGMNNMLREDFQHALRYYLRHHVYPVTLNAAQMELAVGHSG